MGQGRRRNAGGKIGDHGNRGIADFRFPGQADFGDVGHADQIAAELFIHPDFSRRLEAGPFRADIGSLIMERITAKGLSRSRYGPAQGRAVRFGHVHVDDAVFAEFDSDSSSSDTQALPSSLSSSKDLFNNIASYRFSEMRLNVRGYDSQYSDIYLNGIRFNYAMTGYWAGN